MNVVVRSIRSRAYQSSDDILIFLSKGPYLMIPRAWKYEKLAILALSLASMFARVRTRTTNLYIRSHSRKHCAIHAVIKVSTAPNFVTMEECFLKAAVEE